MNWPGNIEEGDKGYPGQKGLITITDKEFQLFRDFIYDHFGINLTEAKRALLVNRLQKILKREAFKSFEAYYQAIQTDSSGFGISELIDAVSTNHTFFFREKIHFDFLLEKALPQIVSRLSRSDSRDLRVWCAAASTGEEPYVLAMLLHEYLGTEYRRWSAGVLATDISHRALEIAAKGIYSAERVEQIPAPYKAYYFERSGADEYRVKELLKKDVLFRRFNLMNPTFPFKKPFQVIFCRNVMIYFDHPTRNNLVNKLYQFTEPGGYLFIGNAESLDRGNCPFRYVAPSVYQRVG